MSSLSESSNVGDYPVAGLPIFAEATATDTFSSPGRPETPPPAYDDDRPPPKYHPMEELAVEDRRAEEEEEERRTIAKQRRVLVIRLAASLLCFLVVGLVVAGAVVHTDLQKKKDREMEQQRMADEAVSELRGPTGDEGLVASVTAVVLAVAATATATATAVPFTA